MKIGVTLGATLNLDNYNSGRTTIYIEDEYLEKEIDIRAVEIGLTDRKSVADSLCEEIYQQVEDQLMDKIARLIDRLMKEKYV